MKKMYRQGDVLFIKVDEIPKNAKPKKTNIIVEGEATGHSHKIVNGTILESEERSPISLDKEVKMWIKAEKKARIVHEEHGPIEIEIGFYIVIRQREYDEEKNRLVFD